MRAATPSSTNRIISRMMMQCKCCKRYTAVIPAVGGMVNPWNASILPFHPPPSVDELRHNNHHHNSCRRFFHSSGSTTENLYRIRTPQTSYFSSSATSQNNEEATSATPTVLTSTSVMSSLRNMVKPFLLKCHPDVVTNNSNNINNNESSVVSVENKQLNLLAIQNLNSYLDTLQSIATSKATAVNNNRIVEIDFVIEKENPKQQAKKKNKMLWSRRKVELALPPLTLIQQLQMQSNHKDTLLLFHLQQYTIRQLAKLLTVAGLPIPETTNLVPDWSYQDYYNHAEEDDYYYYGMDDNKNNTLTGFRPHFRPLTPYEQNRKRFMSNFNWKNYQKVYQQAVRELQADLATEGMIANHASRRRDFIALIVSRIQIMGVAAKNNEVNNDISDVEQLIALRRLSLLLEHECFELLAMEQYGRYWEDHTFRIVLTSSRRTQPNDASTSAMHRFRQKKKNQKQQVEITNGFSFTLHPDETVTIHIPIDFKDDELIQELDRNIWDFYNLVAKDDGLQALFSK